MHCLLPTCFKRLLSDHEVEKMWKITHCMWKPENSWAYNNVKELRHSSDVKKLSKHLKISTLCKYDKPKYCHEHCSNIHKDKKRLNWWSVITQKMPWLYSSILREEPSWCRTSCSWNGSGTLCFHRCTPPSRGNSPPPHQAIAAAEHVAIR